MQQEIVRGIDGGAKRAMIVFRKGRQLSASIPTIGYRDRTDHPWPRILQFIAIITIIYGAARIGLKISEAWFVWGARKTSNLPSLGWELTSLITWLIEIPIDLMLIIGAVSLLRSGSQRLILIGQWGMVIWWFVVFIAVRIMRWESLTLSLAFDAIQNAFYSNVLPIMVILILRAHRRR